MNTLSKEAAAENSNLMIQRIFLLAELQELELIIEESAIIHRNDSNSSISELRGKAAGIRAKLPADILERYDRLRRNGPAVVSEVDGICTGCRLNVPKGDLQRMQNGSIPPICPNCYKFILLDASN